MKISQRNAKLSLDNRNKTFPVEMALVETPQILEAETAAQIIDYNQRVAPIFAEKAMAKNLIRQVKEAYSFGSTPSEIVQSLEGLYARDYYNNHPCFAPWNHALLDRVARVSICCMVPNKPIIGDLRQQSIDFRFSILDFRGDPTDKCGGLRIFDFRFGIDSTDKSGGLYHQEILGHSKKFVRAKISQLYAKLKIYQGLKLVKNVICF